MVEQLQKAQEQAKKDEADLSWYEKLPHLLERFASSVSSLLNDIQQVYQTIGIFFFFYKNMRDADTIGADKYSL